LTLIFSTPGLGNDRRVQFHRRTRSAPFEEGQPLATGIDDVGWGSAGAALSPDGTLLVYSVAAPSSGGNSRQDLYISHRTWPSEPFPPGVKLPAPINSGTADFHPTWPADGYRLYFHSTPTGNSDLCVADMGPVANWEAESPAAPVPEGDYALEFDGQSKVEIPGMKLDLSKPFTIEAYLTQTSVIELAEGAWASPIYSINRVG